MVSISTDVGRARSTKGLRAMKWTGGSFDLPGTVQHQQQAAADHVAQRSIGLLPLPGLTHFADSFRRLRPECWAINWRRKVMSSDVKTRPRYYAGTLGPRGTRALRKPAHRYESLRVSRRGTLRDLLPYNRAGSTKHGILFT